MSLYHPVNLAAAKELEFAHLRWRVQAHLFLMGSGRLEQVSLSVLHAEEIIKTMDAGVCVCVCVCLCLCLCTCQLRFFFSVPLYLSIPPPPFFLWVIYLYIPVNYSLGIFLSLGMYLSLS